MPICISVCPHFNYQPHLVSLDGTSHCLITTVLCGNNNVRSFSIVYIIYSYAIIVLYNTGVWRVN